MLKLIAQSSVHIKKGGWERGISALLYFDKMSSLRRCDIHFFPYFSAWIFELRSIINIDRLFSPFIFFSVNSTKQWATLKCIHILEKGHEMENKQKKKITGAISTTGSYRLKYSGNWMPSDVIDMSHISHAACNNVCSQWFFPSVKQKMSSTTENKRKENTSEFENHKNPKFTIIFYFVWQSTACVFARIVCSMYPKLNDLWLDQVLTATSIRVNQKICAPETHAKCARPDRQWAVDSETCIN